MTMLHLTCGGTCAQVAAMIQGALSREGEDKAMLEVHLSSFLSALHYIVPCISLLLLCDGSPRQSQATAARGSQLVLEYAWVLLPVGARKECRENSNIYIFAAAEALKNLQSD